MHNLKCLFCGVIHPGRPSPSRNQANPSCLSSLSPTWGHKVLLGARNASMWRVNEYVPPVHTEVQLDLEARRLVNLYRQYPKPEFCGVQICRIAVMWRRFLKDRYLAAGGGHSGLRMEGKQWISGFWTDGVISIPRYCTYFPRIISSKLSIAGTPPGTMSHKAGNPSWLLTISPWRLRTLCSCYIRGVHIKP